MFTQPNLAQSPEDVFLTRFHVLSQLLIEDNYTNMRNLNMANHNFNEIFSYLKGIIRHMCNRCNRLEQRSKDLEDELRRIDPGNVVLNQAEKQDPKSLGEAGLKFNQFTPLQARRTNSFASRFITPPVESKSPRILRHRRAENPDDMRQEFKNIEKFISKHLAKYLVSKKQYQIDKDVLVNLYRKWVEKKGKTVLVKKKMLIKMQITNELKKIFMGLNHNDKFYNGIGFREDLADNMQVKVQQTSQMNANSEGLDLNVEVNGQSLFTNFQDGNIQLDFNEGEIDTQHLDTLGFQDLDLENDYELCQGFEGV